MDKETLIIAAILLAISVLPFVLVARNRKRREKQLLFELKTMAQCYEGKIDQHEICGNMILGLDLDKKYVFYLKKGKESDKVKFVPLENFWKCELTKLTNSESHSISIMELKFSPKSNKENEVNIELYNEKESFQLGEELMFAQSWSKLLNEQIKKVFFKETVE